MKRTYTIKNDRTELASVPVDQKRKIVIGNMDDYQAIAMENTLKRSNTMQPNPSKKQNPIPRRQESVRHIASGVNVTMTPGKFVNETKKSKMGPRTDYSALQIPSTGLPFPEMKCAPKTEEEIIARRRALGITTTPDQLRRLARGLLPAPSIIIERAAENMIPRAEEGIVTSESIPPTFSSSSTDSAESIRSSSSLSSTSSHKSLTEAPDSPPASSTVTTVSLNEFPVPPVSELNPKPATLTHLVTVHRSDLDELVYRTRPLSHHPLYPHTLVPRTHFGRLIAEVDELRDRERRYQARQHEMEDLAIELVLGDSVVPGSKSRMQIEHDKEMEARRMRDEEGRKGDFEPPTTSREMERRNGADVINKALYRGGSLRRGNLGNIQETE